MMLAVARQSRVARMVLESGTDGTSLAHLSRTLGVSPSTVRRDVAGLVARGVLVKVHGGVIGKHVEVTPTSRQQDQTPRGSLAAVARAAVCHVRPGDRVGVGTGPGAAEIAQALALVPDLTVFTTSISAAETLHHRRPPGLELLMLGGVRTRGDGVGGPLTVAQLDHLRLHHLIVGVAALDPTDGVTVGDVLDGESLIAFARASDDVTVLAPSSAWGTVKLYSALPLAAVDRVVTDRPPPADLARALGDRLRLCSVPDSLAVKSQRNAQNS